MYPRDHVKQRNCIVKEVSEPGRLGQTGPPGSASAFQSPQLPRCRAARQVPATFHAARSCEIERFEAWLGRDRTMMSQLCVVLRGDGP